MNLRDYQVETLDANASGFFDLNQRRQLTVLPTGTGKTVIFSQVLRHPRIASWLSTFDERQRRMLVIAHREELLDQAVAKIRAANPDLFVEVEQADRRASMFADVVVASVQTLVRRLDKFDPADFRVVIIDEAHHATASTYVKTLQHFGIMPREADGGIAATGATDTTKMLLGFTATTKRGDAVGLSHVFERIAYSRELRWFVERGYLSRLRGLHIDTSTNLDAVATRNGDFVTSELAATVNTPERNEKIVKGWLDAARERKTIAFTADIAHAHALAATYCDAGIVAAAISGETPKDTRRALLADFAAGRVQVLTNCNVLTEGFDEPSVSCIVHARPTKSSLLYVQMTGRGTRLAPHKSDCLILDCVDLSSRHSLITAADLVGLPPKFDVKGDDLLNTRRALDELLAANPLVNIAGVASFADVHVRVKEFDVWKVVELPVELQRHTALAWLATPGVDPTFSLSYPIVEPSRDQEAAQRGETVRRTERLEVRSNQLDQFEFVRDGDVVSTHASADVALTAAEQWFSRERPEIMRLVSKNARWRGDAATENQLKWLKRKRVPHDPTTITKGEASRLLDIAFGKG